MKFYEVKIVNQARELRKQGISSKKIAVKLGVSDSTILRWCYDIKPLKKSGFSEHQLKIYKELEEKSQKDVEGFKIDKKNARILVTILYYCEGSRYPKANYICFTNSDPQVILLFLKLFRLGFTTEDNKFRVQLQIHSTQEENKIKKFWVKLLKIDEKYFYKPTITNPTNRMKRKNYQGTCSIRYYDFRLLHEVFGAWKYLINYV